MLGNMSTYKQTVAVEVYRWKFLGCKQTQTLQSSFLELEIKMNLSTMYESKTPSAYKRFVSDHPQFRLGGFSEL